MQEMIDQQVENLIQCRKRFNRADERRRENEKNISSEIWQEFADSSRLLEQAEENVEANLQRA